MSRGWSILLACGKSVLDTTTVRTPLSTQKRLHELSKPTGFQSLMFFLQNVVPTGHANSINKPYRGIVTHDGWKYACFENCSWVLFNLNEDPYEQANLAHNNRYRAERKKLLARLRQWIGDTGDRFATPED